MNHNGHVVLYRYLQALWARRERRWMSYEFFRQWHLDELRAAGVIA